MMSCVDLRAQAAVARMNRDDDIGWEEALRTGCDWVRNPGETRTIGR